MAGDDIGRRGGENIVESFHFDGADFCWIAVIVRHTDDYKREEVVFDEMIFVVFVVKISVFALVDVEGFGCNCGVGVVRD